MRTITAADVADLESALAAELPGFRIAYKDESRLHRAIARVVRPFNAVYLTRYTTVLGRTVWMPSRAWRSQQDAGALWALLRHEAVHLRDRRRFPILFDLSYVLFLPAVFTLRAVWEARAYRETMAAELVMTGQIADATLDRLVGIFTGPEYLYMCPFPKRIRRHFEAVRADLLRTITAR